MTPKFLKCTNSQYPDKIFILHTETPKFLAEVVYDENKNFGLNVIDPFGFDGDMFLYKSDALKKTVETWFLKEIS